MTSVRHRLRRRPPWWPATEPWPPASRERMWRHGRARFVRRVALLFATLLFFSAFGMASLVSILAGGRGLGGVSAQVSPVAVAVAAGVVLLGLLLMVGRIGIPF